MDTANKLKTLRALMAKNGLDAYLQPMNDEYQNEYLPASKKRIEFLSGFTGSAGFIVVLKNKAAFFTDGRYTLQASLELDKKHFQSFNSKDKSALRYLQENLKDSSNVGYDSWLFSEKSLKGFQEFKLKPLENLVDQIWKNKPKDPESLVFEHSIKFAGESVESKIKTVANQLKRQGTDAVIINSPPAICWLLNIRGSDVENTPLALAFAIVHANAKVDLFIKKPRLKNIRLPRNVTGLDPQIFLKSVSKISGKNKSILVDSNLVPAKITDQIKKSGAKILFGNDPTEILKAQKNKAEIAGTIAAHIRDGAALTEFLCWLDSNYKTKNIDEIEAAEKLYEFRKKNKSFFDLSFPTIAGFAGNGAIVHYRASKKSAKIIKGNELFLLDSGAQYLDGTTDITRTTAIGKPTSEQKNNFTRVLKGHIALASITFPKGITGSELDVLARQYLWNEKLDYDHGTGHGVGSFLGVHEGPQRISRGSNVPLLPGMIISNEPGFYKSGEYGIRIENLILVREKTAKYLHFETITKAPIDTRLINFEMLTKPEVLWLNNYHKQVEKDISKLLSGNAKAWLKKLINVK